MNKIEQRIRRSNYWVKDFLHGGYLWNNFKEVSYIMSHPKESIIVREKYLTDILSYAAKHTNYYRKYDGFSRLGDFPIVNKSVYREHYSDFLVQEKSIPGQQGPLHIQKTSGSTGIPFEIPQDTLCRVRRLATIKAENELVGFQTMDTLLHLRSFSHFWGGTTDIRYEKANNIYYADNSVLTEEKVSKIVDLINSCGIKYIRGYVTSIDLITHYLIKNNIELVGHPLFIAGGEVLTENVRRRIVESLQCHIISQYANEENGVFGQSRVDECSIINLNLANCYLEVLELESEKPAAKGELGRIVVTDFTNHAFPMIRYDIGDVGMANEISDEGQVLSIVGLAGRRQDLIYRTDGKIIDLWNSMPKVLYYNPKVIQWQFVQKGRKDYSLYLSVTGDISGEISSIITGLKGVLGEDADITVRSSVSLSPVLSSGKRKVIVNEYTK